MLWCESNAIGNVPIYRYLTTTHNQKDTRLMPQSSETAENGPSSGSVLSLVVELVKLLSPVFSGQTTETIDKFKRNHLQTIKRMVSNLFHGRKVVLDCGAEERKIQLRIAKGSANKGGRPQISDQVRFDVENIEPVPMTEATIWTAKIEDVEARKSVYDITIRAYCPDRVHLTTFTLKQCNIEVNTAEVFISVKSLRQQLGTPREPDVDGFCRHALHAFIANTFALSVRTGISCYEFSLVDVNTGNFFGEDAEVNPEPFLKNP